MTRISVIASVSLASGLHYASAECRSSYWHVIEYHYDDCPLMNCMITVRRGHRGQRHECVDPSRLGCISSKPAVANTILPVGRLPKTGTIFLQLSARSIEHVQLDAVDCSSQPEHHWKSLKRMSLDRIHLQARWASHPASDSPFIQTASAKQWRVRQ